MRQKRCCIDSRIKSPLREHQKRVLDVMQLVETGHYQVDGIDVRTRVSVLADPPGAGKTLDILSAIASFPTPTKTYKTATSRSSMFGMSSILMETTPFSESDTNFLRTNLIIVPHYLEFQWINELQTHTTLSFLSLERKHLHRDLRETLSSYDVVICKQTMYKTLYEKLKVQVDRPRFIRIVVDEADSIRMPKCPILDANFYWMVSATPERIVTSKCKSECINMLAQEIPWAAVWITKTERFFVVRNDRRQIVQETYEDVELQVYECSKSRDVELLADLISEEAWTCLSADDRMGAYSLMGTVVDTIELVALVKQRLQMEIREKEVILESARSLLDACVDVERIQVIYNEETDRLSTLRAQWNTLEERMIQRGDCPICCSEIQETQPFVTYTCCQNKTCTDCCAQLSKGLHLGEYGIRDAQCPFCRTNLSRDTVVVAASNTNRRIASTLPSKQARLEQIVQSLFHRQTTRVLIFSECSGTWTAIEVLLHQLNIEAEKLQGGAKQIERIVKNFHEGKVQVLMMNSLDIGYGLNLQCATDVIFYHEPSTEDVKTQVIGRALRTGRTSPLCVHTLVYPTSEPSSSMVS